MYIDESVYPDLAEPPSSLPSKEDKGDYIHRICSAWDFHIHPEAETFQLFSGWKDIFNKFPLPTSPAYHAFRTWFGWEEIQAPVNFPAPTPEFLHLDRLEDRPEPEDG